MGFDLSWFGHTNRGDGVNHRPRNKGAASKTLITLVKTSLVEQAHARRIVAHNPPNRLHEGRFVLGIGIALAYAVVSIGPRIKPLDRCEDWGHSLTPEQILSAENAANQRQHILSDKDAEFFVFAPHGLPKGFGRFAFICFAIFMHD